MKVTTKEIRVRTRGFTDIIDLTKEVQEIVRESGLREGSVVVFVRGSTASITTIEYEPGLVKKDFAEFLERIAPYDYPYEHHKMWGDDNGSAHLRASLVGPSVVVPFVDGRLLLGTWQQIVLVDFDTRSRDRTVFVQVLGS
ncbi:MAG: YjbQ family protein [Chlorobi bacterium]|nr:YjbQ family protein [Chlorobiota bacterium]